MDFRIFLLNIFFFLYFISAYTQTDTGQTSQASVIKVKNNIYMLQSEGGNIGLSLGKDGILMVDDHYTEDIKKLQEDINKLSDKPVRFVVNTHFHNDHTAGNPAMAKTGAIIISQEMVRARLLKIINQEKKKISEEMLPMVTFSDEMNIYFNNEKVHIFHVPNAHTDGDAMIYFTQNNVLQMGDLFFNGKYPFIDIENGGTVDGFNQGIQKALSLINKETKIIPGHGPIATYEDLLDAQRLLTVSYKKISQLALLGKTEDEVAKMADITKIYDDKGYGDGFINSESFRRTLFKEATLGQTEKIDRLKSNEEARKKYDQIKKQQESKKGKKEN